MLGVVVLWSTTPGLDKLCIAQSSVGLHGFIQVAAITLLIAAWTVVRDGTGVFGDATPNIPVIVSAPAVNAATFVSQNIPATLTNNQTATITVTASSSSSASQAWRCSWVRASGRSAIAVVITRA